MQNVLQRIGRKRPFTTKPSTMVDDGFKYRRQRHITTVFTTFYNGFFLRK